MASYGIVQYYTMSAFIYKVTNNWNANILQSYFISIPAALTTVELCPLADKLTALYIHHINTVKVSIYLK